MCDRDTGLASPPEGRASPEDRPSPIFAAPEIAGESWPRYPYVSLRSDAETTGIIGAGELGFKPE